MAATRTENEQKNKMKKREKKTTKIDGSHLEWLHFATSAIHEMKARLFANKTHFRVRDIHTHTNIRDANKENPSKLCIYSLDMLA